MHATSVRPHTCVSLAFASAQVWDKFGMDEKEKTEFERLAADVVKRLAILRSSGGGSVSDEAWH